jgi:hypothetical protein
VASGGEVGAVLLARVRHRLEALVIGC